MDFDNMNFVDLLVKPSLTEKRFTEMLSWLNIFLLSPQYVTSREMNDLTMKMVELRRQMTFDHSFSFAMIRLDEIKNFTANTVRFYAISDYACSIDQREHEGIRKNCLEDLERAFNGEEEVTAGTYISRRDAMPEHLFGEEYERITIRRIRDEEGIRRLLEDAKNFLDSILVQLTSLADAKIEIIRR